MNPPAQSLPSTLPPLPPPSTFLNQSAAAQPAQSIPMSTTLPEIPPPHMVAPYTYLQLPKAAPPQIFQPQTPPPAPKLPTPPPINKQPAPPPPPKPQPQPQPPVEKKPKPSAKVDKGVLADDVVKRLNDKLNSEDAMARLDAAGDLMALLQRNPDLGSDPTYKPIVDAFVDKIIADPSEMVRMPALMILQLGLDKNPTTYTNNRLQELANQSTTSDTGMPDTGEAKMAKDGLATLNTPEPAATEKGMTDPANSNAVGTAPNPPAQTPGAKPSQSPQPAQQASAPAAHQTPLKLPDFIPPATGAQPGNQLNVSSPSQQVAPAQQAPQAGQNLNIREGIQR
jgi:hypothetical protein